MLTIQITVNIADTMSILSGGYFKSSIHRVTVPPEDQKHLERHGVFFFVRPNNNVEVKPVQGSRLLEQNHAYEKPNPSEGLKVAGECRVVNRTLF